MDRMLHHGCMIWPRSAAVSKHLNVHCPIIVVMVVYSVATFEQLHSAHKRRIIPPLHGLVYRFRAVWARGALGLFVSLFLVC